MHEDATCNDLQKIITQAINEIKQEQGENFNLAKINLAELERRTGLSRSRLRHLKENNFIVTPHGRTGQKATACILRSLADSDAFQSGRCAEHNGRPETLAIIN